MTPFYLNPPTSSPFPVVEIREDQQHLQLFLSPHQAAASLSSAPAFFDTTGHDQDQRGAQLGGSRQHHQEARTLYLIALKNVLFCSYS